MLKVRRIVTVIRKHFSFASQHIFDTSVATKPRKVLRRREFDFLKIRVMILNEALGRKNSQKTVIITLIILQYYLRYRGTRNVTQETNIYDKETQTQRYTERSKFLNPPSSPSF